MSEPFSFIPNQPPHRSAVHAPHPAGSGCWSTNGVGGEHSVSPSREVTAVLSWQDSQFRAQPVPLAWVGFLKLWPQIMWTNPHYATSHSHRGQVQGRADRRKGLVHEEVIFYNCWVCRSSTHVCMHTCVSLTEALVSEQGWVVIPRYRWENWLASSRWLSWQVAGLGPGALPLELRWVHLWFSLEWDPSLWSAPWKLHYRASWGEGPGWWRHSEMDGLLRPDFFVGLHGIPGKTPVCLEGQTAFRGHPLLGMPCILSENQWDRSNTCGCVSCGSCSLLSCCSGLSFSLGGREGLGAAVCKYPTLSLSPFGLTICLPEAKQAMPSGLPREAICAGHLLRGTTHHRARVSIRITRACWPKPELIRGWLSTLAGTKEVCLIFRGKKFHRGKNMDLGSRQYQF